MIDYTTYPDADLFAISKKADWFKNKIKLRNIVKLADSKIKDNFETDFARGLRERIGQKISKREFTSRQEILKPPETNIE